MGTDIPASSAGGGTSDGVTIIGSGTSGSPFAVKVPLTLANPTTSNVAALEITSNVTTGLGAGIRFTTNSVVSGRIRTDYASNISIEPGVGGFGRLWGDYNEGAVKFTWSAGGIGFFGINVAVQQAVGVALTDNTTGGTASTLSTFAGSVYATDAPVILGNFHQLNIKVAALETAAKAYNLVSS